MPWVLLGSIIIVTPIKPNKVNANLNKLGFSPKNIIDSTIFEHPIFNFETFNSQKKLNSIQGVKNTFYCGSYCGYGFHEDGIQSAAYIANILNTPIPWIRKKNFQSRLNY